MALPRVVIEGRMASEPELRFIPSGSAVCSFRVAASERRLNQQTQQWEDGRQCFISVTCWRDMAENVTESLHVGDPVVVQGKLFTREWERDGQKQSGLEMEAESIGPNLRNATAHVQRTQRSGATQQPAQADPWATPAQPAQGAQRPAQAPQQGQQPPAQQWQQGNQQGWGSPPAYDEPPF